MAALVWGAWGEEWALSEKVSFNGTTKHITVNAGVTALDIAVDVYSAWARWTLREDNLRFPAAMDYSGYDEIPGGRTGATFFAINGWKLVYDPSAVAVTGVLYSRGLPTAYWSAAGNPIYPATVSSLVNSSVSYTNVVTGTALTVGETTAAVLAAMTPDQIAAAVRAEIAVELARLTKLANLSAIDATLVVTPTTRTAGSVSQTISTVGDTTTVA